MRHAGKKGFTLVETMVVSALMTLVMSAVLAIFLVCQRIIRQTMADAELSLTARSLREKLLFRLNAVGAERSSGLLNATDFNSSGKSSDEFSFCSIDKVTREFDVDIEKIESNAVSADLLPKPDLLPKHWLGFKGLRLIDEKSFFEKKGATVTLRFTLTSGADKNAEKKQYVITLPCYGEVVPN
ncbi:MAG: type II secretion system protein [Kiritimatiellia bacterium]